MVKMAQSVTTGLTKAWNWLRDSSGASQTVAWAVSYWPMLAAAIVGLPVALMPMWLDLSAWVYAFSLPLGITAGMIAFLGAYMMLDD